MNNHFCTVGKKLAEKMESTPNQLINGEYEVNTEDKHFDFKPIVFKDVRTAMAEIKTSKGHGIDQIASYFLKLACPWIEMSLAYIFNNSLQTSTFPDAWKVAKVTPIFKSGDKNNENNYRPISVLPVISRLFEKIVYNQLYNYLNESLLLSPEQSGF